MRPPALVETSWRSKASTKTAATPARRAGSPSAAGRRACPGCRSRSRARFEQTTGDHVDADVLVAAAACSPARNRKSSEKRIPLDLEKGVRAVVERLADDRVGGADQHGGQNQPVERVADALVQHDRSAATATVAMTRDSSIGPPASPPARPGNAGPPDYTATRAGRYVAARVVMPASHGSGVVRSRHFLPPLPPCSHRSQTLPHVDPGALGSAISAENRRQEEHSSS